MVRTFIESTDNFINVCIITFIQLAYKSISLDRLIGLHQLILEVKFDSTIVALLLL